MWGHLTSCRVIDETFPFVENCVCVIYKTTISEDGRMFIFMIEKGCGNLLKYFFVQFCPGVTGFLLWPIVQNQILCCGPQQEIIMDFYCRASFHAVAFSTQPNLQQLARADNQIRRSDPQA
jgi:hypothetical protein